MIGATTGARTPLARLGMRIAIWLLAATAAWVVAAWLVIPTAIGVVYRSGPAFLWRFFPGRDSTPVEAYLVWWWRLERTSLGWFGLVVLLVVLAMVVRHLFRNPDPAEAPGRASGGQIILVMAWFGLAAGLFEGYFLGAKIWLWQERVADFYEVSRTSPWMAPPVTAAVAVSAGLTMAALRVIRPGLPWFRLSLALGTGYLFFVPVVATGRLHWAAVALLGLGLGARLTRRLESSAGEFSRLAKASAPIMVLLVMATAAIERADNAGLFHAAASDQSRAVAQGPNVLWLVLDTERAASSSLYGFDRPTTPFLEQLADQSVVFDRAIATESWTLPSHASMFTSQFNTELGSWFHAPLDDRFPTIAEVLSTQGYRTAGFVANFSFVTDELFGLDRGFDLWRDQPMSWGMALASSWPGRQLATGGRQLLGNHRMLVSKRADRVVAEFLEWRRATPGRPYFAFLNFFDAHGPYLPVSPPVLPVTRPGGLYWLDHNSAAAYSAEELVDLREHYEAAIAYLDSQVAVLFDSLAASGELENTIAIITSDHGEHFGEHGKMGHVNSMYLSTLHVPLMILGPGVARGMRVAQPVSLTELPATVSQLLGLDHSPFRGVSLARFWTGGLTTGHAAPAFSGSAAISLVAGQWHYLQARGREELYHLPTDPEETANMAQTDSLAAVLTHLRQTADSIRASGSRNNFRYRSDMAVN